MSNALVREMKQEIEKNKRQRRKLAMCLSADISIYAFEYCCSEYIQLREEYERLKKLYQVARRYS